MRFLKTVKNAAILVAVLLLNSLSFAGHASAMNTMSHEMSGMNHSSNSSSSCATLCRTAVVNKEEYVINLDENEDDDEPTVPFYALAQPIRLDAKSAIHKARRKVSHSTHLCS